MIMFLLVRLNKFSENIVTHFSKKVNGLTGIKSFIFNFFKKGTTLDIFSPSWYNRGEKSFEWRRGVERDYGNYTAGKRQKKM